MSEVLTIYRQLATQVSGGGPGSVAGAGARRLATLGVARGLAALLGLAGVLLVARALTPDQLGRWSLALAVQGYALHLGEFGLRSVVTTEAARAGAALPALLAPLSRPPPRTVAGDRWPR